MLSRASFSQSLIPKSQQDDGSNLPISCEKTSFTVTPGSPACAAQLDAVPIPSECSSSHHRRLTALFSLSLSFREPQDLATSGPEADLYPEGWRHCEPTNPIPGDHASPMLGP